jgi:hypothetical protein
MQTIRMTELEFIDHVHSVIWRVQQDLVQVIIERDGKNIAVIQPFPAVFMDAPTADEQKWIDYLKSDEGEVE